jgi:adenosine/AMP kinase
MELKNVRINMPEGCNIIIGQTHFIKTAEDLYEIITTTASNARFGIAFTEASGPCLIRTEGNDSELVRICVENLKTCQEVCTVYCATANPLEVIVAESEQGRGILGVIDGFPPRGVETDDDKAKRKDFLRKIGYKL